MATALATETPTVAATGMTKVTVNAAFLQEIKEVNLELWHTLDNVQKICARPTSIRPHCRRFVEMLAQLRDQLAMHFALEEAYGYFDEPVSVAPRLSRRANDLRIEHRDLYLHICEIVDQAERLAFGRKQLSLATDISLRFRSFHDQLLAHEAQETDLILEAYDDDIGVGD